MLVLYQEISRCCNSMVTFSDEWFVPYAISLVLIFAVSHVICAWISRDEFNPLLFGLSFMPFIGYVLFWRAFTEFRRFDLH